MSPSLLMPAFLILTATSSPNCPTFEGPPLPIAPQAVQLMDEVPDLYARDGDHHLGVGHITVAPENPRIWDWWEVAELPLFESPNGPPWGWLHAGQLRTIESASAWTGRALHMVETGYEQLSLVVHARQGTDWFAIAPRPALSAPPALWVHRCHLETAGLAFETWQTRLLSDAISPLFFRAEIPHRLRAGPGTHHPTLRLIPGTGYHLAPLEIDGDWMHVTATIPSDYCASDDLEVVQITGWVRWRDDQGPWVWYFTRGC